MNAKQFALMTYQWVVANILPAIAPDTWQQQVIVFKKGRELVQNMHRLAKGLNMDANGNIDLTDLESRIDDMLKVNPIFAYPINEPMLALIGVAPEHVLKFSKQDFTSFFSYLRGTTTTTEVTL